MLKKSFYVIALWGSVIFFFLANQRGCRGTCFQDYVVLYFIFLILLFISYHILKAKPDVFPQDTNTNPPQDPLENEKHPLESKIANRSLLLWGAIASIVVLIIANS